MFSSGVGLEKMVVESRDASGRGALYMIMGGMPIMEPSVPVRS